MIFAKLCLRAVRNSGSEAHKKWSKHLFLFLFLFFFTDSFLIRAMDSSEKEGACSSSLILIGF